LSYRGGLIELSKGPYSAVEGTRFSDRHIKQCGNVVCGRAPRLWFYFCLRNNKPGQRVLFHVVNFSKSKSLYRDGMSPTAWLPVQYTVQAGILSTTHSTQMEENSRPYTEFNVSHRTPEPQVCIIVGYTAK